METVNYDELEVEYDSNSNSNSNQNKPNNDHNEMIMENIHNNNNTEMIDEAAESVEQFKKEEFMKEDMKEKELEQEGMRPINRRNHTVSTSPTTAAANNNVTGFVDRKTTCPFMVKMYCRINGHHRLEEFNPPRFPVEDEIIVYTWKDANLHELSLLVREVLRDSDSDLPGGIKSTDPNLKFSFQLLYPDASSYKQSKSKFITRPMGWAFEGGEPEARAHQLIDSSARTLESFKFIPGDFIDVAIYTNPAMIPKVNASSSASAFSRPANNHFHGQGQRNNGPYGNRRVHTGGSARF